MQKTRYPSDGTNRIRTRESHRYDFEWHKEGLRLRTMATTFGTIPLPSAPTKIPPVSLDTLLLLYLSCCIAENVTSMRQKCVVDLDLSPTGASKPWPVAVQSY